MNPYTIDDFLKKAKSIHKDKYDYSNVRYVNSKTKVTIICPKHGAFQIMPGSHINRKSGCVSCSKESIKEKNSYTTEEILKKFISIHGNKYDYSLVKYTGIVNDINIICKTHGTFKQSPNNHIRGTGCPKCIGLNKTVDDLINDFTKVHGSQYDYSLVNHTSSKKKIDIICKKHGTFKQIPNSHLSGNGCPSCNESKGERQIKNYLIEKDITFIQWHKFNDCKHIKLLSFDFYLPTLNICVEFDGEQHFQPYRFENKKKSLENFEKVKLRDQIKNEYCINNNIILIRIKYNNDIQAILNNNLY